MSGFSVRFGSARSLRKEHDTSLSKGGMLVPWRETPPPENSMITMRIEAPDGTKFELPARVGQSLRDLGFMVVFEPSKAANESELKRFIESDMMQALLDLEQPDGELPPPEVLPLEENDTADVTIPAPSAHAEVEDVLDAATIPNDQPIESSVPLSEDGQEPQTSADIEAGSFRRPEPGEAYLVYVVKYARVRDFADVRDQMQSTRKLEVEVSEVSENVGKIVEFRLTLPGHNVYRMWGLIETVSDGRATVVFDENNEKFRQAYLYVDSPNAKNRMKTEAEDKTEAPTIVRFTDKVPEEDDDKMPLRRRLQRMGMEDKINLALSGGREERMALAMDSNKAIPHYLLRNARISLDEIAFMARLPTMNPDVLDKIAENPQYTQNSTVVKALVYNPKTPPPTAIRLLDRLPRSEIMNLAKRTNMNQRLVMAAKKKVETKRG